MRDMSYETLLALHYLMKDIIKTQLTCSRMTKAVYDYFQLTYEEIYRRLDSTTENFGEQRFLQFPWGSDERYVDYDRVEKILSYIRESSNINKTQRSIDEQFESKKDDSINSDDTDIYNNGIYQCGLDSEGSKSDTRTTNGKRPEHEKKIA